MLKESNIYKLRHSLAHVLGQAVLEFFPDANLGFGPPIETGFYYDFDFGEQMIKNEDLKKIEKQMRKIIGQKQEFHYEEMNGQQALEYLKNYKKGRENYKITNVENLIERGVEKFSFYTNGSFLDLCEGPHVANTGELPAKAFKLDRISAAYWLGNEKNPSLTRIYALCFETNQELKDFIQKRELAKKFSHQKLGRELELFDFNDLVGKGLPLWLPKGTIIRDEIQRYAENMEFKYGYERVHTPHLAKEELYLMSQHLPAYKDSMFPAINDNEGNSWYLKPMNCPHHHLIFSHGMKSYRQLPYRLAEYGTCYRYEKSGELSGLLRVRCMTMNDGHIYLKKEQLKEEFRRIMEMYLEFYETFKLKNYSFRLSIRGEENKAKFKGDSALWDEAESFLEEILKELKVDYYVGDGEAAFYGPKIDIQFKNLMGREETVSTIQVDYLSAKNFKLKFVDEDGSEQEPIIIHRAPLSTHERFISFLVEYYGGAFPTWCSPTQVVLLPVNDAVMPYCQEIEQAMKEKKYRVIIDDSSNSFGKKIRVHTVNKVPNILIIGEKEHEERSVTIRRYGQQEQEYLKLEDYFINLSEEIEQRIMLRTPMGSII